MSIDIFKNEMLIGKAKDEVVNKLGPKFFKGGENYFTYSFGFLQVNLILMQTAYTYISKMEKSFV